MMIITAVAMSRPYLLPLILAICRETFVVDSAYFS